MKTFTKYSSIENSYRKEYLDHIVKHGFADEEFVIQEKVHGANLSFWTDGNSIKTAKRTAFLDEEESFYNYQVVRDKYESNIFQLFKSLKSKYPEIGQISIYGELFGGTYPHKDVAKAKNATIVQKGVFYNPENDFYAFDLKIDGVRYLDAGETEVFFKENGFFYAQSIFKGKLTEALEYANMFESKIPGWLGLPAIEGNICEGIIIKPLKELRFGNGSRVILKNKNEKWSERKSPKKARTPTKLSGDAEEIREVMEGYITENRLNNVISKLGEVGKKDVGKLIGMFSKDAQEDFIKDFGKQFEELEKVEQKSLKKSLNGLASKMVVQEIVKV